MCLGVPMKIISVEDPDFAIAELEGASQAINISLLENLVPGEHVIVHAGFAIERVDADEAAKILEVLKEAAETME